MYALQVLVQEEDYEQAIQQLKTRLKHCRDAYGDYSSQVRYSFVFCIALPFYQVSLIIIHLALWAWW